MENVYIFEISEPSYGEPSFKTDSGDAYDFGWYWWDLEDGLEGPHGPFKSEEEARQDACKSA